MAPMELIKYTLANDANTVAAREAALQAAQQLADLRGLLLFGMSPSGEYANDVFDATVSTIDELITKVDEALGVLSGNLRLSANLVLKGDDVATIDFRKLASDNDTAVNAAIDQVASSVLQPGDAGYVDPAGRADHAPDPAPDGTAGTAGTGTTGDGSSTAGPTTPGVA